MPAEAGFPGRVSTGRSRDRRDFDEQMRFLLSSLAFALAAVVFCALWQRAAHDTAQLEALAQSSAREAYTRFSDYWEHGHDSDYWGDVAAFHCFQSAYTLLAEDADANRAFCSEVYGCLLIFPDRAKAHMAEIAAGMQALSDDIRDETAYLRMSALRIALQC